MNKQQQKWGTLFVSLVVLIGVGGYYAVRSHRGKPKPDPIVASLKEVTGRVRDSRQIADADLEWCLTLAAKPSSSPPLLQQLSFEIMAEATSASAVQRARIFKATLPFLAPDAKVPYGLATLGAMHAAVVHGGRAAIPYLEGLSQSPYGRVSESAQRYLKRLGSG